MSSLALVERSVGGVGVAVGGVCGRGEMSRVPREGGTHSLTHMYINTFHIEGSRTRTVCGMVLYGVLRRGALWCVLMNCVTINGSNNKRQQATADQINITIFYTETAITLDNIWCNIQYWKQKKLYSFLKVMHWAILLSLTSNNLLRCFSDWIPPLLNQ